MVHECASCQAYISNYKQTIAMSKVVFDASDPNCDAMPEDLVKAILAARDLSE